VFGNVSFLEANVEVIGTCMYRVKQVELDINQVWKGLQHWIKRKLI